MRMSSVAHDEINELSNAGDSMQSPETCNNIREHSPGPSSISFDRSGNNQIEEEQIHSEVIV